MQSEKCPHCYIGTLQRRHTTLTRPFGANLILIPNVEVVVCDVCAEVFRNEQTLSYLDQLLGDAPAPPSGGDASGMRAPQPRREGAARRSLI